MTGKQFLNALSNGGPDVLGILVDLLRETQSGYCVIGGLAVNAYAEPVVSLDVDLVVVAGDFDKVRTAALSRNMQNEEFPDCVNLSLSGSDLRIQMKKDSRYQVFIERAVAGNVLGYKLLVASLEDVLQGKIWAFEDTHRRKSKRQKDLADILRLVENHPRLKSLLPPGVLALVE